MLNKVLIRLKNPKVVLSVVSGITLVLVNLGLIDVELSEKALTITNTLLGIGISIGVFGNPDSHVQETK